MNDLIHSPSVPQTTMPDSSQAIPADAGMPKGFSEFSPLANPEFVRSDRQTNFKGTPPSAWPVPNHDRNGTTVDRVGESTKEGPHRFIILRGDTVRIWKDHDKFDVGKVVAISVEKGSVCIQLQPGERGIWIAKEKVYPAAPEDQLPTAAPAKGFTAPMSGRQIQVLMRAYFVTIDDLAEKLKTPAHRVREVRNDGLSDPFVVREWIKAITGVDPGHISNRNRDSSAESKANPSNGTAPPEDKSAAAEQRRKEATELAAKGLEELNEALRLGKSETLVRYLDFVANFHNYSFQNCILIYLQRPGATHVAGYGKWKSMKRHVRKGEKGISIFAPLMVKRTDDAERSGDKSEEKASKRLAGFRLVKVFDVSQTDGEELPEFTPVTGTPGESLAHLENLIQKDGIELVYDHPGQGALGTSSGGTITVRPDLPEPEKFSVLAHEYAHEMLHHGERRNDTDKTVRETEAEAVAYIVSKSIGVNSKKRSADYISLYRGNPEVLQESLDFIQKTAARIISGIKKLAEAT